MTPHLPLSQQTEPVHSRHQADPTLGEGEKAMAGAMMIGATALVEAFVAATVCREQMRDLADDQWRAAAAK